MTNTNNNWHHAPGNKKHDGELTHELITGLFVDNNNYLYTKVNFANNVPEHLRKMVRSLHEILSKDPNANIPLLEGAGKEVTIDNVAELIV